MVSVAEAFGIDEVGDADVVLTEPVALVELEVVADLIDDVRLVEDVGRTVDVKMVLVTVHLQPARDQHLAFESPYPSLLEELSLVEELTEEALVVVFPHVPNAG